MNTTLSSNIRKLRKQQHLTQEQLAEALNVTIGAVSKWENNLSSPDLSTLVELAVFFHCSIDALMGYTIQHSSLEDTCQNLKTLLRSKQYEEGIAESKKALRQYPNHFEIVYTAASIHYMYGMETSQPDLLLEAVTLFERSIPLLSQNRDSSIDEVSIYGDIASALRTAGHTEQARTILAAHNPAGIYDHQIAVMMKDPEEALLKLSDTFYRDISELFNLIFDYASILRKTKRYKEAMNLLDWSSPIFSQLTLDHSKPSLALKMTIIIQFYAAIACQEAGDTHKAKERLSKVHQQAVFYEENPTFQITNVRFYHNKSSQSAYDSIGENLMDALDEIINTEGSHDIQTYWLTLRKTK